MNLPSSFSVQLADKSIVPIESVYVNLRKSRWCIKGMKDDAFVFVKWNDNNNELHWKLLNREKKIYIKFKGKNYIQEILDTNDDSMLVLQWLDVKTLRTFLKSKEFEEKHLTAVIEALEKWKQCICDFQELRNSEEYAAEQTSYASQERSYLGKLMLSGPMEAEVRKIELIRNRILLKILKVLLRCYNLLPSHYSHSKIEQIIVHGDFHLNNIICRQQTADSRQQTADSRQQTADSRQQTADSRLY